MSRIRAVFQGRRGLALIALGCSLVWLVLPGVLALAGYAGAALTALLAILLTLAAVVLVVALTGFTLRALLPEGWNDLDDDTRQEVKRATMAGQASSRPELAGVAEDHARRTSRLYLINSALLGLLGLHDLSDYARGVHGWADLVTGVFLLVGAVGNLFAFRRRRRAERLNRELDRQNRSAE